MYHYTGRPFSPIGGTHLVYQFGIKPIYAIQLLTTNRLITYWVLQYGKKESGPWALTAWRNAVWLEHTAGVLLGSYNPCPNPNTTEPASPVAGGVLVYESRAVGRELVGFEEVENWDSVRSALAARGIGVGAIHRKPVLDE